MNMQSIGRFLEIYRKGNQMQRYEDPTFLQRIYQELRNLARWRSQHSDGFNV
jgi:hypothetical protein